MRNSWMSRESVAWVTSKPRRRSLRLSSSWLVTRELATSSLIALCLWYFIDALRSFAGQIESAARSMRPRLHKYTTKVYNYAKADFPPAPIKSFTGPSFIRRAFSEREGYIPNWPCRPVQVGRNPSIFQAEFHKQRSYSYLWAAFAIFHPVLSVYPGQRGRTVVLVRVILPISTPAFWTPDSILIRVVSGLWRSSRRSRRMKFSLTL